MKKQWMKPIVKACGIEDTCAVIPLDAHCKDRPNLGPNSQGRCRNPSQYPECPYRRTHVEMPGTDADCSLLLDGTEPIS